MCLTAKNNFTYSASTGSGVDKWSRQISSRSLSNSLSLVSSLLVESSPRLSIILESLKLFNRNREAKKSYIRRAKKSVRHIKHSSNPKKTVHLTVRVHLNVRGAERNNFIIIITIIHMSAHCKILYNFGHIVTHEN